MLATAFEAFTSPQKELKINALTKQQCRRAICAGKTSSSKVHAAAAE